MPRHEYVHPRHPLPGTNRNRLLRRSRASQGPPTRPRDGHRPQPIPTHDTGR